MLYTNDEVYKMSIFQRMEILKNRADKNECDGSCDEFTPFIKCEGCNAGSALNDIGETLRNVLFNRQ